MIKIFNAWFKRQKIFFKLFFTFSIAVVLMLILIMIVLSEQIKNNYLDRLIYSADQSFNQANTFIQSYTETMENTSELIANNSELQLIMSSDEFTGLRGGGTQYREFLSLSKILSTATDIENINRANIYIPSDILYSNNNHYFFSTDELSEKDYYEDLVYYLDKEELYFTISDDDETISLFRNIKNINNSYETIGLLQISIKTSLIQNIVNNSNITKSGLVFLINEQSKLMVQSNSESDSDVLELAIEALSQNGISQSYWSPLNLLSEEYLVRKTTDNSTGWSLIALLPKSEIDTQTNEISNSIFFAIFLAVGFVFLISFYVARYYGRRFKNLRHRIALVQSGLFDLPCSAKEDDELGEITQNFDYMATEMKKLLKQQYESGQAIKSAQLKALQSQINPHFLYNTLDMINWKAIENDSSEISQIVQSLAHFYRLSLNKGNNETTIRDELFHVKEFVSIENFNLDHSIALSISADENLLDYKCLSIILQPLVENSIMHGISDETSSNGLNIEISVKKIDDDIVMTVKDNGVGMTPEQIENIFKQQSEIKFHGYAVHNVNDRIKLFYGENYGLSFLSEIDKGTEVKIVFKAIK